MKKIIVFSLLLLSCGGFVLAAKPKKVTKSAVQRPAMQTKAKVAPAEAPKKLKKTDAFQAWLKDMKRRVTRSNAKPNQLVAVAAVRGDETKDAPPLYWKGKKSEGKVEQPEMKEFESAINIAMEGDTASAKEKLQSFLESYPKSSLVPDAKETLARLDSNVVEGQ